MNAYLIDYLERDFQDFVFAETKESAEQKFLAGKSAFGSKLKYPDESNIRLERCKKLDNCESLSKMEVAEKLITDLGWCWGTNGNEYDQINFDKQKFERDWDDRYWGIA